MNTIRVEVDAIQLTEIAKGNNTWANIHLLKHLRKEGIPAIGGIELRGVEHGCLKMSNGIVRGRKTYVYEWTPGPDSPVPTVFADDDEI